MNWIRINGSSFYMGSKYIEGCSSDYETPQANVEVGSFWITETTITNAQFKHFVEETGYITTAERLGSSYVFFGQLDKEKLSEYQNVLGTNWWISVPGTSWKHPYGPSSTITNYLDHPVVHVSIEDALVYCEWIGGTLPSEAQWEYAARGGTTTRFPWGDELTENGIYHANTWQGEFPHYNSERDGYFGTAPVHSYPPNNFGIYQMIGNVWEWCRNERYTLLEDFNGNNFSIKKDDLKGEYAIRGGSFLCHESYCNRYRVAARNGAHFQSTSSNLGFRCIKY
ncbi:formylglycine-generating enzyme family protein [Macrococcoides canis]|uniref:formylglycine-generating enzyme family protein n=1 Tax=Macrococcoides canis TaxID=1855823 RepID=UPI00165E284F|nr:formylglycine-generating enzyme family protein [Macrococcus canis]QNR06751.1 SUMF1/EgtB/PvdO family nonheme iron enzyme [Macrococcus canis]